MLTGMKPPARAELPRITDRISFLYVERCQLEKDDGAIVIKDDDGTVSVPAGQLLVLMLGPGTTITHRMIQTAAEAGMAIIWCGEEGVRFYAGGSPLSGDTKLLLKQAAIVSNQRERIAAAKRMYQIRYPDEDFSNCTMKQLLGKEGRRVTQRYRELADQYGMEWKGRRYNREDYDNNSPLDNALSNANACLYGVCYAAIYALGLSPGLGIIHTGKDLSFVLDIADLYKEKISIPTAFQVIAQGHKDYEHRVRAAMRDQFRDRHLISTIVEDIEVILDAPNAYKAEVVNNHLWAGRQNIVSGGKLYGLDSHKS